MDDWFEPDCDINMMITVSGSRRALEAWEWAEEHGLLFKLIAESRIIPLEFYNRIRFMITPPYDHSNTADGNAYDLTFMFLHDDDLMAFKLRWLP